MLHRLEIEITGWTCPHGVLLVRTFRRGWQIFFRSLGAKDRGIFMVSDAGPPTQPKRIRIFADIRDTLLRRKRRLPQFGIRPYLLRPRVKHVHGPTRISYDLNELLVISVVRNGELYIKSFLDHYRSMGVKHFVFLDNGSTDRTVENALCARGRDRTVNECPLPEIREHDEEVFGREILARQVESLCRYR